MKNALFNIKVDDINKYGLLDKQKQEEIMDSSMKSVSYYVKFSNEWNEVTSEIKKKLGW